MPPDIMLDIIGVMVGLGAVLLAAAFFVSSITTLRRAVRNFRVARRGASGT